MSARPVVLVLVLVLALPSCSDDATSFTDDLPGDCDVPGAAEAPKGFVADQTLTVSGVKDARYGSRRFHVFVPPGHDGRKQFPLVFEFHGDGGNGPGMRRTLDLEAASKGGAVIVYPDGLGSWDLVSAASDNDDMKFVRATVEAVAKRWCVDRARIFATGYSNGGFFANQLGCKVGASLFRGVASHSGGGPFGEGQDYDAQGVLVCPEKPVAALIAHGLDDTTVEPSEGETSRDHWKRRNGCDDATESFDPSPCVRFQGCAEGRPVVWCPVPGIGHVVWPAGGAKATWSFLSGL